MIIDFHVHTFPDHLAENTLSYLQRICDIAPRSDGTVGGLFASMERGGITYSVLQPVATKESQVSKLNNLAAQLCGEERLFSFGAMHPAMDGWKAELDRIHAMGLPGIKLHHDYAGVSFDDPRSIEIMRYAGEKGLMVLFHGGDDPISKDVHHCSPRMVKRCLPALRGTTLIAAHFGGLCNMEESMECLVGEDIYFDTSTAHQYFGIYHLGKLLKAHSPDRILFGSDSPWEDQGTGVRLLESMGLGDALVHKIVWENPARLLGL